MLTRRCYQRTFRLRPSEETNQIILYSLAWADVSFYFHEVAEATMMGRGMSYDVAHAASLSKYGVSPFRVYHPEVIQSLPGTFNSNWAAFWEIK